MKLRFYEKVVVTKCEDAPDLVGASGHVLGIGDERGEPASYDVLLDGVGRVVCFTAEEVRGTGEIAERSQFYDDAKAPIRVRVVDGKGYLGD